MFYGNETGNLKTVSEKYKQISSPKALYDILCGIWNRYTCTPRLRNQWSEDNKTLGTCSVTAFLAQDVFGGKVLGIHLPDGSIHCYNEVDGHVFDLTSEQFGGEVLQYGDAPEQFREEHFVREEKRLRYEYLRDEVEKRLVPPYFVGKTDCSE